MQRQARLQVFVECGVQSTPSRKNEILARLNDFVFELVQSTPPPPRVWRLTAVFPKDTISYVDFEGTFM